MAFEIMYLFSKNLTQRRKDVEPLVRELLFVFFASLRLCVIKFGQIMVLLFLPVFFLQAQDSRYFLDTSDNEPRFIQRISWEGGEYAFRYEVVIEKESGGGSADEYRELLREFTAELFIEVSLAPGKYRCYVIPYDYLDKSGARSDLMYIEVLAAMYPELDDSLFEFVYSDSELADAPPKKFNLFLGAAWMPSIAIYDEGSRFFDDRWSPLGAAIRFGIVSTTGIINLGAELTEALSVLYDGTGGEPRPLASAAGSGGRVTHIDSTVNFLMRNRSPGGKTALTFRLGIGFSLPLFGHNEDSPPFTDSFYTNIGVSFLVFVWNNVYMEGGIDYTHWFSGSYSGNYRPWFGVGLKF
jgi:hypothetical protein